MKKNLKDNKEQTRWRKVLSRPKDRLGTFLAVKAIALDVQRTAREETVEKGGAFRVWI